MEIGNELSGFIPSYGHILMLMFISKELTIKTTTEYYYLMKKKIKPIFMLKG